MSSRRLTDETFGYLMHFYLHPPHHVVQPVVVVFVVSVVSAVLVVLVELLVWAPV